MKKYVNKVVLVFLSVIMIACNSSDEEIKINDFKGFYKIKSISSIIPVDLNNDGLKPNNYLQEIKSNYISYNGEIITYAYTNELRHNFSEAKPTRYQSNNNTQFFDIRFPIKRIN
ncbi:hypothetical protein [Aquimarina sp. AD10]|uniref:hypothetical protein n=1 Tax=Aquimarina sp. AD10 TaxID=1714849 RepID=UPI000EA9AFC4|nr:hypothetical protein [Aquimarina sp. AD10]RKM96888.1 hypothetical protein D7033_15350 [Aquimarina sp. AD10]